MLVTTENNISSVCRVETTLSFIKFEHLHVSSRSFENLISNTHMVGDRVINLSFCVKIKYQNDILPFCHKMREYEL